MCDREDDKMNLKLNNGMQGSQRLLELKKPESSIKEERRRTGRYIAILVGICLFLLAMYHAWVRRIPIVASLVVPALIMFVYVAWVLYTAARDKHRLLALADAEAALQAECLEGHEDDVQVSENLCQSIEIAVIANKETSKVNSPDVPPGECIEEPPNKEGIIKTDIENHIKMPIILINDKLPEDLDQKWFQVVESLRNSDKFKLFHTRRKYKRKFCRRKHVVFKRSYSIA